MRTVTGTYEVGPDVTEVTDLLIKPKPGHAGLVVHPRTLPLDLNRIVVDGRATGGRADHGIILRGAHVDADQLIVSGCNRACVASYATTDGPASIITATRLDLSDAGWAGFQAQGGHRHLAVEHAVIDEVNRDGGTSADGLTAYDEANMHIRIRDVIATNIHRHHGIHVSGYDVTVADCHARKLHADGGEERYAAVMAGHTKRGHRADIVRIVGCSGDGTAGGRRGIWVREADSVQIDGGTFTHFDVGAYLEECRHVTVDGGAKFHPVGTTPFHVHRDQGGFWIGTAVYDKALADNGVLWTR